MSKYQYWLREYLFRILRKLPLFLQKSLIHYWIRQKKKNLVNLKTPAQIILYVTNRCNARCTHCFYWREVASGLKKELPLKQLTKIAKSLKNPLATLSITGGEPFLRKDLALVVKTFVRYNRVRKVNIATNGYFTQEILKQTKEMIKLPVDLNIQVSLDGPKDIHDQIRQVAVFEKAVTTLRNLEKLAENQANFQVTIQATLTKYNLGGAENLAKFVRQELPKVHLGFQFVRSPAFDVYDIDRNFLADLDPQEKKPLLSLKQMDEGLELMEDYSDIQNSLLNSWVKVMNRHIVKMKKEAKPFTKCLAGQYDAVIWPDGQVSLCEFTKPFAKLSNYRDDFYRLWSSKEAFKARQKIKSCFCTHTCNLMSAMQFEEKALLEVLSEKK